jgi:hypothetical protein
LGSDSFEVNLYDGAAGAGSVLSNGLLTQTILNDQANTVNVTFNGIVASFSILLNPTSVTVGTSTTVNVTVNALDADGNTIVGPGAYIANATNALMTVALADSDTSGATQLATTSFTAPPIATTLSYDGTAIANPTITVSAPDVASQTAILTVAPAAFGAVLTTGPGTAGPTTFSYLEGAASSLQVYQQGNPGGTFTTQLTGCVGGTTFTLSNFPTLGGSPFPFPYYVYGIVAGTSPGSCSLIITGLGGMTLTLTLEVLP